jgi:hypothetical protein
MLLPLSTLVATMVMGDVPGMVNPGTPSGVPASYDCAVRIHAWEFGKKTLPSRGVSAYACLKKNTCTAKMPKHHSSTLQPAVPVSVALLARVRLARDSNWCMFNSPL